jgi:hypothetical protein
MRKWFEMIREVHILRPSCLADWFYFTPFVYLVCFFAFNT